MAVEGSVVLQPVQIAPNVYFVRGESGPSSKANQGFMSNAGFVVTREGVVVFDALGTSVLGLQLIQAIANITSQPIRRVIVSHYHADHFYGLQSFQDAGVEIWAHRGGKRYLASDVAQQRLSQRRQELSPWVDGNTRLAPADRWLEGDTSFNLGEFHFDLIHSGPAHSPEDLMLSIRGQGILFVGDLLFAGRIPFVGDADSKQWLVALDKMLALRPRIVIPGHGQVSTDPDRDLTLTREYLAFLRSEMARAIANFESFESAYERIDWSRFKGYPAFEQANRGNAYNTFILMEQEALNR